jgi:VWFA-related protein
MKAPAGFFALVVAAVALAQQPYFESFEVRLHNLDVIVTNAQGNPVRGLTKEDFIVRENGVEHEVTNFSVYDASTSTITAAAPAPAASVEPPPTPRRVIFFVDDMSLRKPVRKALIDNGNALLDHLQPGDLATVIRPTGRNRVPQPFTTDTAAVRGALAEAIESCKLRFTDLDEFASSGDRADRMYGAADERYEQSLYAQRSSERVQQRLAQLRALVASMAGVEGRKMLVLLTDGLPSIPGRIGINAIDQMRLGVDRPVTEWGPIGDFNPLIDELARTAAANGVTIYAIEPQVPLDKGTIGGSASSKATRNTQSATQLGTASDAQRAATPVVAPDLFGDLMHFRAQTLRSLAERTGGHWTRGVPMIDDLFRQVTSDLASYYSLAYRATAETGKPRKVTVSVRNRPELNVRTRSEVIDRAPEREMGDLVASTLLYPRNVNELRMSLEPASRNAARRRCTYRSTS